MFSLTYLRSVFAWSRIQTHDLRMWGKENGSQSHKFISESSFYLEIKLFDWDVESHATSFDQSYYSTPKFLYEIAERAFSFDKFILLLKLGIILLSPFQ